MAPVMLSTEALKLEASKDGTDGGDVQGSVEDVAALASAAQPTGYTLATTTVHTKARSNSIHASFVISSTNQHTHAHVSNTVFVAVATFRGIGAQGLADIALGVL